MKKLNNFFKKLGIGAIILSVTLMPLTACSAQEIVNNEPVAQSQLEERGKTTTAEMEDVDFSKYEKVKEPLEDAREGMFKVNLVTKDGKVTRIDSEFQNGIKVLKGRTAVSMYDMSQTVSGIDLSWNQESRIATAKNEGNELKYPIDRRAMSRNGKVVELDVAATVDSKVNRTYLPLRSLMESLGYDVEYHDASGYIDILEKGTPKQDHSKDVVKKPEVKPGNEKPAGVSGKKSEVVKVYEGSFSKSVTHSLPELEDLSDTKTTLKDQIKGKNIIKSEGRSIPIIYDGYKVLDGSYYYSNTKIGKMHLTLPDKAGDRTSVYLKEATFADSHLDPSHGDDPRFDQMQTYAFEDTDGNLYISDGHEASNKKDIYTGKTIKYVYKVSDKYEVVIKVELPNPQPIK